MSAGVRVLSLIDLYRYFTDSNISENEAKLILQGEKCPAMRLLTQGKRWIYEILADETARERWKVHDFIYIYYIYIYIIFIQYIIFIFICI